MTDSKKSLLKIDPATYLAADDGMSSSINRSIEQVSLGISPLARFRLSRVRGAEALKLAESALAEYMAAKRRTFVYQVGLTEDHVKKVMLSEGIKNTALLEREIAAIIGKTVTDFETLIMAQEEAAYRAEIRVVENARVLQEQGEISERRGAQLIASVEASTDKIVETVRRTTRDILDNLERRFDAALKQS